MKISKVLTRTFISIVVVAALLLELCWNAVFLGVSWLFASWTTPYIAVGTWISTHVQYDLDWIEDQDSFLDVIERYGLPDYYEPGIRYPEGCICYRVWEVWPFGEDGVKVFRIVKRDGKLRCESSSGDIQELYVPERRSGWVVGSFLNRGDPSERVKIVPVPAQPPYEDEFWIRISLDGDSRITHVEILRSYPES